MRINLINVGRQDGAANIYNGQPKKIIVVAQWQITSKVTTVS